MRWSFLIVFLVGCSGYVPPPPPTTTPVVGKVYSPSGSPLTGGRIVFTPKDKGSQQASGEIGTDGSYKLTSFNKDDGAMAGEYIVTIDKVSYKTGSPVAVKSDVPRKYLSEGTSDVVVLVGSQTDYPIKLK